MRPPTVATGLQVVSTPAAVEGPLLDHLPTGGGLAWLRRGEGFVAFGEAVRIDAGHGEERIRRAAAVFAELAAGAVTRDAINQPGSGLVAVGSFTFDPRSHGSTLLVPRVLVGRRGGRGWRTSVGHEPPTVRRHAPQAPDRVRYAGSSMPDLHWLEAVSEAVGRIDAGELDKVVLARDYAVWSKTPFDPVLLARRLATRFPGCFTFLVHGLLGATPELLVRRAGRRVESLVLAGSARRGADPEHDTTIGTELLNSKKDRAEHDLAVASVREVLARCCVELAIDPEPSLFRLANVQHLATRLTGRLAGDPPPTALELVAALHPTAAVGGVPCGRALEVIRELEGMDRGRYAGPVGWIDARGDGEWGIALRCAELSGARARLFAGAGIVAGSLPEAELEETRLKLLAMQSAFEG